MASKKKTKEKKPTLKVGNVVRITKSGHEFEGSAGVIREIKYATREDAQDARSGDPELALYAEPGSLLIRTRGASHALVSVTPGEVEQIDYLGPHASPE